MARQASTYRQARRAAWLELKPQTHTGEAMDWFEFNRPENSIRPRWGSEPTIRDWAKYGRSKYTPHVGDKQRSKAILSRRAKLKEGQANE